MALCLLGFRGSGYSPAFIAAMRASQAALREDPDQPIRLVDGPDRICDACPNLGPAGCTLGGPDHEAHMHAHDREVLRRLGLAPGSPTTWREVLTRIRGSLRGADLAAICTTCPWLPLGVCASSVDALRNDAPASDVEDGRAADGA
jgi:uncharacterized protein